MKENLESELKQWEEEFLREKDKLEKEKPFLEDQLNNQNSINQLMKKYFEKKQKIIEKYSTQDK